MKLSKKGFDLITSFEALKLESYLDPVGVPTIGYGTIKLNGFPVALGMKINEPVAVALCMGKCNSILSYISAIIRVELNQNQVDALCSFIYNLGEGAFSQSSLLMAINGKLLIDEDLFTRWSKGTVNRELVTLPGLMRRRKEEYKLFTMKEEAYVSPV